MKIQKKKTSKTVAIVVLVVAFILAGGATYWYLDTNGFFDHSNKETQNEKTDDTTDAQADKNTSSDDISNDENKGQDNKPPTPVDDSGKKVAQINIVDASQYDDIFEVRAGVTNLTEEGGQCEFTFTRNSDTLTYDSKASFTGTNVNCETLDVPVSDFPSKGEWQMVVKYTSSVSAGASQSRKVVVK
jgi:hypothetical protein